MNNYGDWFIIDEDEHKIVGDFTGTEQEAVEWYEGVKDERTPEHNGYWNTWSLYKRWTA